MTAADVNVPELVARAIVAADDAEDGTPVGAHTLAAALLAALRSPKVVAGIAGVLREHRPSRWRSFANNVEILRCCGRDFGPHPTRKPKRGDQDKAREDHERHVAAAVVEWLAGGEG